MWVSYDFYGFVGVLWFFRCLMVFYGFLLWFYYGFTGQISLVMLHLDIETAN